MKKISRRNFLKVTAAGAVGAATLSLTGCGGSKDNGTTSGSTATSGAESKGYNLAAVDSSKNTEVVLWHNRGGKAGELLEQTMIPKFNETVGKEMGITVTPVYQSSSDLISKVKALILAKDVDNLPDMVQVFAGDAEYMSTVPYVVPAQSLIEADESFDGSELLPQLVTRGVDGVFLVVGDEFSDDRALREEVSHLPIPAVMVDRAIEGLECDKVMFDHEMGGYMATRYLIEQGHRRIACLVNARRSNTGRKRLAGYERALREVGLPIDARLEFESEYYIPSAYEASEAVLATDATAVFASSDNIALGLLKRLHEMGKSIPGDISVVSYDNSAADVLFEPALTAIEQDPGVLAEHAFGCMSKRLAGRGGRRAEEVVLEPALIVKGSVLELTKHN